MTPVDYVALLARAKQIVTGSVLYRRFIDGTPLENDLAVWMTDFAVETVRDDVRFATLFADLDHALADNLRLKDEMLALDATARELLDHARAQLQDLQRMAVVIKAQTAEDSPSIVPVARAFVAWAARNGGCSMCGSGIAHTTDCFAARMAAALVADDVPGRA